MKKNTLLYPATNSSEKTRREDYDFEWNFDNNSGKDTAVCVVDGENMEILTFTLNGKHVSEGGKVLPPISIKGYWHH